MKRPRKTISGYVQVASAKEMRQKIREHMDALLGSDAVLAVPSAPGPAPVLGTPQNELHNYRKSLIALTSIAGLAGLPQVCVHTFFTSDKPFGQDLKWPKFSPSFAVDR